MVEIEKKQTRRIRRIVNINQLDTCYHFPYPYINEGYRLDYSYFDAIRSLFQFHNETMNIYSHLIGLICVIALLIDIWIDGEFSNLQFSSVDQFMLELYFICAALCLLFSASYHLLGCVSSYGHRVLLRLDLTGIALLVAASFVGGSYFGFKCNESLQFIHLGLSLGVLVVGLAAPYIDYTFPGGIALRPFIFAFLVVFGFVPFTHWCLITPPIYRKPLLPAFLLLFFFYGSGFIIFLSRYPEKAFPKSFIATQVLSSHTLWHLCVLCAIFCWTYYLVLHYRLFIEIGCEPYQISISNCNIINGVNSCS